MSLCRDLIPIKFHPYRSYVTKRLLYLDYNNEIERIEFDLIDLFNEHKVKCHVDNKIVFECKLYETKIYYGFYDLKFSIGLDYVDDNETKEKQRRLYYESKRNQNSITSNKDKTCSIK
jgi:hypothetical protein